MKEIDFVITWVNGNDVNWQTERSKYEDNNIGDLREERYRDWDNLQYWFRSVEKYAPWVHKIYFVTYGHVPIWLNIDHPKIEVVCHEDFIPSQYLPTFSARPIEFHLHRIKGLSEQFVYFNDDMFLTRPVKESDFFRDSMPLDAAVLNATSVRVKDIDGKIIPLQSLYVTSLYNIMAINRHFDKNKCIRENLFKWLSPKYGKQLFRSLLLMPWPFFLGFSNQHLPYSYLKTTFYEVWDNEKESLITACEHKFREPMDISGRLMAYWQIAKGTFSPRRIKDDAYFRISGDSIRNQKMYNAIKEQKYKMICLNDECNNDHFDQIKNELIACFELILPDKCEFER